MLAKALLLRQLYLRKLAGEMYCESVTFSSKKDSAFHQSNIKDVVDNCALCELSKYAKEKMSGYYSGINVELVFITLKPIVPYTTSFEMITNIANNVFLSASYSIFSVIKCNVYNEVKDTHISVCKEYLKIELDSISPKLIILFGKDVAKCILDTDDSVEDLRGRIINIDKFSNKQKNFIVTYAINDLIKHPSLKKFALNDFMNAKQLLIDK